MTTRHQQSERDVLVIVLPILIVLSSLLFLLVIFLVLTIVLRRRNGISLGDNDGPVDLSRDEFADGAGGFAGVESRWLESVDEETVRRYQRAKEYQTQYPPNSQPSDITLSQFLSIQEKGVSAWSFEPDYEMNPAVLVHARTELTFLPDPLSAYTVQSNLPLPKLNEVYYWEVKLFDLPLSTNVSIGLTTKPYPAFRLPGHNRYSIAYHSNGDKSHNYPFTSTTFGPSLKEGDTLGIGYRPRSGTVFFTRNGRKTEDAFVGLSKFNLFPSIGADGPCSVHVNLGQAGFVHIEANVKKWGLAPSQGTLAPPPAYGSESGSILLQRGGIGASAIPAGRRQRTSPPSVDDTPGASTSTPSSYARRSIRSARRAAQAAHAHSQSYPTASTPIQPSPLRTASPSNFGHAPSHETLPSIISEEDRFGDRRSGGSSVSSARYMSPTDLQYREEQRRHGPDIEVEGWQSDEGSDASSTEGLDADNHTSPAPPSPDQPLNPPTPNITDIHLRDMNGSSRRGRILSPTSTEPPEYTMVDPARYPDGLTVNIPEEILAAAFADPTPHRH